MERNIIEAARIFKAFGDENRLLILKLLQGGEKCGLEILAEMSISQSTLSHHMKILCFSGIVESRKSGKQVYYRISPEVADRASELLREMTRTYSFRAPRRNNDDMVIL